MKNLSVGIVWLFLSVNAWGWGSTGHRVVGGIADKHLSAKAREQVAVLLSGSNLSAASVWADRVRDDPRYQYLDPYHFSVVEDGQKYDAQRAPAADVVRGIRQALEDLRSSPDPAKKLLGLRLLAHFMGDIHQPLHVGRRSDRGGNRLQVTWLGQPSNLHRVWDGQLLDHTRQSYTDLIGAWDRGAEEFAVPTVLHVEADEVEAWANESVALRDRVYNFSSCLSVDRAAERTSRLRSFFSLFFPRPLEASTPDLGQAYFDCQIGLIRERIVLAGRRLAAVVNGVFETGTL